MPRKNRIILLLVLMLITALVVALVLFALRQNLNLFYTPTELLGHEEIKTRFRVGGFVKPGSIEHKEGVKINFILSDKLNEIMVSYNGVLPDLFKEGQGVIALGRLNKAQVFEAEQILAKHDENYRAPELVDVT